MNKRIEDVRKKEEAAVEVEAGTRWKRGKS